MVIFKDKIKNELGGKLRVLHNSVYSFDNFVYFIYFQEGTTITKISKFIDKSDFFVVRITNWAKKFGLVRGEKKGRNNYLFLTDKGKNIRKNLVNVWNILREDKLN